MAYSEEIKKIRQKCFLSQEAFGREIGVSFSSVNRWEAGKTRPNIKAMKNIKAFCEKNNLPFEDVELAWLNYRIENSEEK